MFNTTQLSTLQSAVDRIIPADDYPGGWEAGVGDYLARLLVREVRFVPMYRSGLDGLDAEARAAGGGPFAGLGPDAQDALLGRVGAGDVRTAWAADPALFFRLLVEQAAEGYYADPGNGGNKNGIGWDMIGYKVTA